MKIKLLSILSLLLISLAHSQVSSAEIIYSTKFLKKVDSSKFKGKYYTILKEVYDEANNIETVLKFIDKTSSYSVNEVISINKKEQFIRKRALEILDLKSKYYQFLEKKELIRAREFDGKFYNISSSFKNLNWIIDEKSSKLIKNYLCYKATTTKTYYSKGEKKYMNVVAWYSPSIPVSLGPKNYVGLPGLVLEVKEGKNRLYYATNIKLNSSKLKPNKLKKGVQITEAEFLKMVSKVYDNLKKTYKF